MKEILKKTPMPKQPPEKRRLNFKEVAYGYTAELARREAMRCIECKNRPCQANCPVNVNIPEFIRLIKDGDFGGAYDKITEDSNLPAICGRVCPQEDQCEKNCLRGIKGEPVAIGALERFAADWYMGNREFIAPKIERNGIKAAVVGAGPAGLTCAADLAKYGFDVTVFEAFHKPGGVLSYGIPEFRLPKDLVRKEINNLKSLGVRFELNVLIGRSVTIDELFEKGYAAVFIGSGAGLPTFMKIPGENYNGVYFANEYLTRSNLMKAYDPDSPTPIKRGGRVAVVGAGNVAMDAARTALRLGAEEVFIVYRRSREEMPARREEIENAEEEGVKMILLTAPIEVLGIDHLVTGLKCLRMRLGEPDKSGRRSPAPIENSEYVIPINTVIVAIGQSPHPLIRMTARDIKTHSWGGIIVNEQTMETTKPNVYAGGDAVTGSATVISAMGAGKKAAAAINEKLK